MTYFLHLLVTRGKLQKIPSAHISLTMYFAHKLIFSALPILKNNIKKKWFLFGMISGVDSYSRHYETINK